MDLYYHYNKKFVKEFSLFVVILLSLVFVCSTNTYATTEESSLTPSEISRYNSRSYVIDKYDVDIIVNEDNTFDITETIDAYFNTPQHGIYRTIPAVNRITRLDGTTSTNYPKITNVSVDNEYTESREGNNYVIKIGSPYFTVKDKHTYVIKYTYTIGNDPLKDYDELYFNIIGTEWSTVIGNITFSITMPKEFDSSKLGFSSGVKGSVDNSKVNYTVSGNTITGNYDGILYVDEGITVRCELPEGYFVKQKTSVNLDDYILCLVPIIFLIISISIWYKYGRDDEVIETVEFYPPEGLNSLEVGYLYKGKAISKDVTSLLIYLANKGYIKIIELEKKSIFSHSSTFKIIKLKEYDGDNINERLFLEGLFSNIGSISLKAILKRDFKNAIVSSGKVTETTENRLSQSFYLTMDEILSNINSGKNKSKIFERLPKAKKLFIKLMMIATFIIITIPPVLKYKYFGADLTIWEILSFALKNGVLLEWIFPSLLVPGIGLAILLWLVFGETQTILVNGRPVHSALLSKAFGLVWGLLFGGIPWAASTLPALRQNPIYMIAYVVGILCIIGMIKCLKYLPKRTPYGTEMLGKIRGFKNFLQTARKEELEEMVMQNPTYFYDILPYTYVLDVSDKWIKKFESISLQEPTWYDSPNAFSTMTFGSFINSTMNSANAAMSNNPASSSSSSGGSSGGGSSGGGSGGGGGGSW